METNTDCGDNFEEWSPHSNKPFIAPKAVREQLGKMLDKNGGIGRQKAEQVRNTLKSIRTIKRKNIGEIIEDDNSCESA